MKEKPGFSRGDKISYCAGKVGYHYGLDNGTTFTVVRVFAAPALPRPRRLGYWGGWLVEVKETNMALPAGWFRLLSMKL